MVDIGPQPCDSGGGGHGPQSTYYQLVAMIGRAVVSPSCCSYWPIMKHITLLTIVVVCYLLLLLIDCCLLLIVVVHYCCYSMNHDCCLLLIVAH